VAQQFSEDEANRIYSEGLQLAQAGKEKQAIEIWRPLAESGDINTMINVIIAYGQLDDLDSFIAWMEKLALIDFAEVRDHWKEELAQETASIDILKLLFSSEQPEVQIAVASNPETPEPLLLEFIESHRDCQQDSECCFNDEEGVSLLGELATFATLSDEVVAALIGLLGSDSVEEPFEYANVISGVVLNSTATSKHLEEIFDVFDKTPEWANGSTLAMVMSCIERHDSTTSALKKSVADFLDRPAWWNPEETYRVSYDSFRS
jgi:hypothetical protein